MPSVTDRRVYEDQIPPFMTVFDLDAETMADQETVTLVDPKFVDMEPKRPGVMSGSHQHDLRPSMMSVDPTHKHHDSTSTQTSESADSSPTTTLSTTDSSPLSDASPSSSPDSPTNLIPLNNFPATSFGTLPTTSNTITDNSSSTYLSEPPRLQRPMTSPSPRRARNMKGLSIQPPFGAPTSTTTISLVSEPSSPSFIKPMIPAMKRKPSQLSLNTNTSDLVHKTTLEVPPSPAMPMLQRRALKHSCSSPHMSTGLKSATFGPPGGMTFPKVLERNESGLSEVLRPSKSIMKPSFEPAITEEDSPIRTQMANRDDDPYRDNENNEDVKTPGYPDGPIAIYGDNIYLYSEPTADQAARFDVVINCAREVGNPFEVRRAARESRSSFDSMRRASGAESPIPDTAVSTASFTTAFEFPQGEGSETPTTPKAFQFKEPEYIHIPWDHNTDIAPDLMDLCDIIDNRTKAGKRVLIHCQQGASRSASLIIAYGLFQKPDLTVNDAYYAAQAKSKWISPNMKLMYSLQDFQKEVSTKRATLPSHRPRTRRSPSKHRLTLSADAIDIGPKEPRTAPLPTQTEDVRETHLSLSPNRARGSSTPGLRPVSPGPASAPPICTWNDELEQPPAEQVIPFKLGDLPRRPVSSNGKPPPTLAPSPILDPTMKPPPSPGFLSHSSFGFQAMSFPQFNPAPSFIPSDVAFSDMPVRRTLTLPGSYPEDNALLSPRAETMTNNPLHEVPEVAGMRFVECPPTPSQGLFSPRAGMFPRDPFSTFGSPPVVADPRSPPTRGEAPIIRSIDDML
ncbi:hypothetical protein F66182_8629 [Fusarium sp. NRRL 66182]|nr:hypothetical protein F66182_8629 [Fusarium sp. NRRL 66182]